MTRYWKPSRALILAALFLLPAAGARAESRVRNFEGVSYISGGVADDDLQALEATGGHFNLKVTNALANGHFVADTPVQIRDSKDKTILDVVADGPLLFVQLPAGAYTVRCSLNGQQQEHKVQISEQRQQLACTWISE